MRDEYSRQHIDDHGNVTAFNMERFDKLHNASRDVKNRFHPVGWTAVPDRSKCTGCGKCLSVKCPQDALSIGEEGLIEIDQNYCVGCGICKAKCEQGAIKIRQTMPMRDGIREYFLEDFSLNLRIFEK